MKNVVSITIIAGLAGAVATGANAATYGFDAFFETVTRQSTWAPGDAAQISDSVFVGPSLDFSKTVSGSGSKDVTNPLYAPAVALGCKLINACPSPTITYTGTGSATLASAGKIGLEFGYSIDAGSVAAKLNYGVGATIPDAVKAGQAVNLGTTAVLKSGELDALTPNLRADIDQITELKVTANIKTSIPNESTGKTETENITKTLVDVDEKISLVNADVNSIKWLEGLTERVTLPGGDPLVALETPLLDQRMIWSADLPTKSLAYKIGNAGYKKFYDPTGNLPSLTTEIGRFDFQFPSAEGSTTEIKTSGSEQSLELAMSSDFLDATLDLDGVVGHAVSLPFGVAADVGKNASLWGDALDAETGVSLDVYQTLKFFPRLDVFMTFDNEVEIDGTKTQAWAGNWMALPDIVFFEDTTVTPVFDLYNTFHSTTGLDFGVNAKLDLVKLGATLKIYGRDVLKGSFGPLYQISGSQSLATVDVYENAFQLLGFEPFVGDAFFIDVIEDDGTSAVIPLPASAWLFLGALGLGFGVARRPVRGARDGRGHHADLT